MRKSNAPSKSVRNLSFTSDISRLSDSKEKSSPPPKFGEKNDISVRSAENILNLLIKPKHEFDQFLEAVEETSADSKTILTEFNINKNIPSSDNTKVENGIIKKRYFNVVYGKQSKKKHKTWEGDGILEVGEKSLLLKDCDGKTLGQGCGKKNADLEEGSRLFVGSKEVEIIDLAPTPDGVWPTKRSIEDYTNSSPQITQPIKKKKINSVMSMKKNLEPVNLDFKPLVMPKPDCDHQWLYNTTGVTVTEVSVDPKLTRVLREHQRQGVIFIYRCVMGYQDKSYVGSILADEMGLGKTLQCITLIWTLLKQGPYGNIPVLKTVLIVTPSSLTNNWKQEFMRWLGNERIRTFVVDQKNKPNDFAKLKNVPVMIISYEMFVRCYDDVASLEFDLLICDEGHRLKNSSIRTSMFLKQLSTKKRIILTGTPVQNDLQEFFALVDFVNPGFLGTYPEFKKKYEDNIIASRQPGTDDYTRKEGELQAQVLMKKTSGFILRRTQELLDKYLPTKHEAVVFCKPSKLQVF
uniref:Helicase ATP-binding domain-containing protein n=1 Tax=Clastoptera arizonana TaxID=38151 RepID=A0A1B6CFP3_9HEMI